MRVQRRAESELPDAFTLKEGNKYGFELERPAPEMCTTQPAKQEHATAFMFQSSLRLSVSVLFIFPSSPTGGDREETNAAPPTWDL